VVEHDEKFIDCCHSKDLEGSADHHCSKYESYKTFQK